MLFQGFGCDHVAGGLQSRKSRWWSRSVIQKEFALLHPFLFLRVLLRVARFWEFRRLSVGSRALGPAPLPSLSLSLIQMRWLLESLDLFGAGGSSVPFRAIVLDAT